MQGWSYADGVCMHLFEEKRSWLEAERACKALDSDLLSIHSRQQDEMASKLASGKDAFCWIGMNDWLSMGDYVWSDGEPVVYSNFNPGEPNGAHERTAAIMMLGGANGWVDAPDIRQR